MKKNLVFLLSFSIFNFQFSIAPVLAQSADTPIASDSQTIKQEVQERIKTAVEKNLKNTQQTLGEETNRLVGYAGVISDIKQNVLVLENGNTAFQVSLSSGTTIIKDGQPLKAELISVKDQAIIIGNFNGPGIITAKRIVISKKSPTQYTKNIVFSPIIKIDTKKKTITLKIDDKNQEVSLGKLIKLDLSTLTTDQKIFGIVMTDSTGSATLIQAKII